MIRNNYTHATIAHLDDRVDRVKREMQQELREIAVELALFGQLQHFLQSVVRIHRGAVRTIFAKRRIDICNTKHPAKRRNLRAAQAVRVTGSIAAFMMSGNRGCKRAGKVREPPEQNFRPVLGVRLDQSAARRYSAIRASPVILV